MDALGHPYSEASLLNYTPRSLSCQAPGASGSYPHTAAEVGKVDGARAQGRRVGCQNGRRGALSWGEGWGGQLAPPDGVKGRKLPPGRGVRGEAERAGARRNLLTRKGLRAEGAEAFGERGGGGSLDIYVWGGGRKLPGCTYIAVKPPIRPTCAPFRGAQVGRKLLWWRRRCPIAGAPLLRECAMGHRYSEGSGPNCSPRSLPRQVIGAKGLVSGFRPDAFGACFVGRGWRGRARARRGARPGFRTRSAPRSRARCRGIGRPRRGQGLRGRGRR